jgi:hypothetical protein
MLLRTAYLAGFWYSRLFYHVHFDWLWADMESDMGWVEECFSETRAGINGLVDKLQAIPPSLPSEIALRELDRAREYVADKWCGEDHEKFIERRDQLEREWLSTEWENRCSILHDPIWSDLRSAVGGFVHRLPAQLNICWMAGLLVAQVDRVGGDRDGRQFELVGEEYPIPILQSCLIQLQREVRCLKGIDIEITKPRRDRIRFESSDAVAKTRKLHKQILARLDLAARSPLDSSHNDSSSVSLELGNQTCCVAIGNPDICEVIVNNKVKTLTPARFDVVMTLVNAFPGKLNKDQLPRKSGHNDAVNMLKALAKSDQDWNSVILLAGSPGKGYGLKGRSNG